jgi:hypothetical protein
MEGRIAKTVDVFDAAAFRALIADKRPGMYQIRNC